MSDMIANKPSPNVEDQIAAWRRALADLSEPQRDELEDHLREHIAALEKLGLCASEAFAVAAMRMGRASQVCDQFERADAAVAWVRRLRWMILGFVVCAFVNLLLMLANNALGYQLHAHDVHVPIAIALRILVLNVFIFGAVALSYAWLKRRPALVCAQPPAWLTGAWTLAILVAAVPWAAGAMRALEGWLYSRNLSSERLGSFALSSSITGMVLPFTTPLVLLIISVQLARFARGVKSA